ncbi:hypothetical protein JL721_9719 [Aureococcus anophagefferens]|nr:hypothetical protein JL721_9719 [Aureococcus anophagefferens]
MRKAAEAAAAAEAKAAEQEVEEFTMEFLTAAKRCFEMIDKDNSGTLTKTEIVKAVAEDEAVVKFLRTCGEENLQFLLQPRRLEKALEVLDTSKDGEVDAEEWEEAVFDMIDVDRSGSLDKAEVVKAVQTDEKVINFLVNCGNQNLQYLWCPRVSKPRSWCWTRTATARSTPRVGGRHRARALGEARGAGPEARGAGQGAKEIEEFTHEFQNAARKCFEMIDKDGSGTLTKTEIVKAVSEDESVVKFLRTCGEENLQFLLVPARLEKALEVLDTSKDGEVDVDEWEEAIHRGLAKRLEELAVERERRDRAAAAEDEAFSVEFLSMARQVFDMIDVDGSGSLDKAEVVKAVKGDQKVIKFLVNCGNPNLQYLLVPARLEHALAVLDTDRDGEISGTEWEGAIETALANKLEVRGAKREEQAKAARKEIEEFTNEFVSAARKCFEMIDKDNSGTLTKVEIVKAIAEDKDVVKFLKTCGEENLQFLLFPARLEKALQVLDTSNDGELDVNEWEDAIQRGLAKRLDDLANERERRERAAQAEDEAFSVEFLSAARQVFDMIDVDQSRSLDKAEVVKAVKTDQKVIKFLVNCGNQNLQYLLVPARLEAALNVLDTDRDGEISGPEWEEAIESALANKLEARAAKREAQAKAARKEIEEFTADFVNAARKCFEMIDKDGSGTLTKVEIVKAVSEDPAVVTFLKNCGEENLQFLLVPARLEKALEVLDTSNDGEVDIEEWEEAIYRGLNKRLEQLAIERERRERAAQAEDEAFSTEFLSMARQVFDMMDADQSGSLDKGEVVKAVQTDQKVIKFLVNCGNPNLQYLLVPARLEAALAVLDTDRDGEINGTEWEEAIETALANKLEARAAQREQKAKAARKEIEEFTGEFLSAARRCFQMIDKDGSGTLTKVEIVKAIAEDADVVKFLQTCGEENLQFLLRPARLEKALEVLDTSNDGELDVNEWEDAIHRGLAKRLDELANERERRERAAAAADEEFSSEFLSMARQVFDMIDVDQSGSLDKAEVVKAVQTDDKCIRFLKNCGNENLQYLLVPERLEAALNQLDTDRDGEISGPEWEEAIESALQFKLEARAIEREEEAKKMRKAAEAAAAAEAQGRGAGGGRIYDGVLDGREAPRRLEKALEVLDTSKDGEVDAEEWEEAVNRGLSKRLEQLENERQRRLRAAKAADQEFSVQFLSMARQVFDMIDVDQSGSLDKAEVVKAVQTDKKVLDTDRDGEINAPEWEDAIEHALSAKLEARAQKRVEQAKAARKEIEEFTHEFQNAARKCFEMIDKDGSGTLTKTEIVKAVSEDESVVKFLRTCGEENLQFLLVPARLEKALEVLDTSKDGEVDVDEWEEAIHRGLAKRLEELAVFDMIDVDGSGSLDKAEVVTAIKTDQKVIKFLVNCGNPNLQYLLVPARLEHALAVLDTDRDGEISGTEWEGAIETALANKLEARAAQREEQAKAARKEIEEFTGEFLSAARQCFQMIDKDNSGTLTKAEIIKAIAEDKDVVKFLKNCGEENLQFLLRPKRLEKALDVLDTSNDGELDIGEWEDAIHRGLAKRLDELANERERRERAALAEDEAFSTEFLSMARQVFDMMDADQSGALDKAEVVKAVKTDKAVIKFLVNCGNENLQYLLVPARLEAALNQLDTDRDGEISGPEWEEAIESALANKLEARAAKREAQAKAARKEMEEFTQDFVNAAIKCFEMIDKDGSGTLTKVEIVKAVAEDPEVVEFLRTCGEDNLQFLLMPKRLEKALQVLDTSNDGEVDVEEWEEAIYRGLSKRLEQLSIERERRERAAAADDEEFTAEFLSAARQVFDMIDVDQSGSLDKAEVIKAIQHNDEVIAFLINCGNQNLQYLLVPARLESALAVLDTDRDGEISGTEWEEAIETALANKLEARAEQRKKDASAARKEIAEFTAEFMSAARKCFEMIDEDDSGTLTKKEIKRAVQTNDEVISFLKTCGEENLQFLLKPKRIDRALNALDTSSDGELDIEEWEEAIYRGLASRVAHLGEERERRERAARAEDEKFTMEFLMAAREVYDTVDEDGSGTLNKSALVGAVNDANALLGGEAAAPSAAPEAVGPTVVRNVDADGVAFFIDTATGERTATLPDGATVSQDLAQAPAEPAAAPPPAAPAVVEIVDASGNVVYVDQATGKKMDAAPEGATITKAPAVAAAPVATGKKTDAPPEGATITKAPVVAAAPPAAPAPAVVEFVDPASGETFYVDQATGKKLDAAPEGAKITKAPAVAPSAPPPAPAPAVVEIVDPETGETFYVDQATGAKMDAKPEGATVTKAPVAAAPPPVVAAPPPAVVEIVDPATGEAFYPFYVDLATGAKLEAAPEGATVTKAPAAAPDAAPAVVESVDESGQPFYVDLATGAKLEAAPEGASVTKAPAPAPVAAPAAPAVIESVDESGQTFFIDLATGARMESAPEGASVTKAAAPAPVPAVVAAAPAVMESVDESGQSFFIDLATGAKLETAPEGAAVTKAAAPPAPAPVAAAAPAVMESVDESGQTCFIDLATGAKMASAPEGAAVTKAAAPAPVPAVAAPAVMESVDESGKSFYIDLATGATLETAPEGAAVTKAAAPPPVAAPAVMESNVGDDGEPYFINLATGERTAEAPPGAG